VALSKNKVIEFHAVIKEPVRYPDGVLRGKLHLASADTSARHRELVPSFTDRRNNRWRRRKGGYRVHE
jgi:hypothetical protein